MRLSPSEYLKIEKKQNAWREQGLLSGNGEPYKSITKQISRHSIHPDISKPSQKKTRARRNSNLLSFIPVDQINRHALALSKLAKDPTLKNGLKVNGKTIRNAAHEHWDQVKLFNWIFENHPEYYPDFAAIPNGGLRA